MDITINKNERRKKKENGKIIWREGLLHTCLEEKWDGVGWKENNAGDTGRASQNPLGTDGMG